MTGIRLLAPLAALALLAACDLAPAQPDLAEAPLAGSTIGGDFDLVDTAGKTVRWGDFAGTWRIVYFGYAYCPDVCPFDVQRMMAGYDLYGEQGGDLSSIAPIFITIDPARDTQAVVGEFTRAFSDDLIGLTGTPEQVDKAAKAFAVFYSKGEENAEGGYLMDHSNLAYLMDPDGKPIATLPLDQGPDAVAAELAKWVR